MSGWICLHRKLLEWEWYDDIPASRLFIHCLLKANHKEKKWKGQTIPRGSFITGRSVLAEETGLTEQQIRTAISKLKSTSDLTIKATNKFSLVTVVNYRLYQDKGEQTTSKATSKAPNEQPTDNQQSTTTNNDNNDKQVNNKNIHQQIADIWNEVFKDELPAVAKVTQKRKSAINGCIAEMKSTGNDFSNPETWRGLFEYCKDSDFLMGRKTDWAMTFDFIVTKSKLLKVIEGDYENARATA